MKKSSNKTWFVAVGPTTNNWFGSSTGKTIQDAIDEFEGEYYTSPKAIIEVTSPQDTTPKLPTFTINLE